MRKEVLRAEKIHKTINGSHILKGLNLTIYEHEILGMAGLSGSGKSIVAEILSGNRSFENGKIWAGSSELEPGNRKQAVMNGIYHIKETPCLFSCLSIGENICLMESDLRSSLSFPSRRQERMIREALRSLNLNIDLTVPVTDLSLYEQHQIMIVRAFYLQARLLILDNITNGYTEEEFRRLAYLLLRLKQKNMGILMIESMPERVAALADRMVILRNGREEGILFRDEYEISKIRQIMIGSYQVPKTVGKSAQNREEEREILFSVQHIPGRYMEDISFYLKKGEVIGFIDEEEGICTDVLRLFLGKEAVKGGMVELDGRPLTMWANRKDMIREGIGYVDYYKNSIFLKRSLRDNLTITSLDRLTSRTMIHFKLENMVARDLLLRLGMPVENLKKPMKDVSNQEQLVAALYKWILNRSRVVVLNNVLSGTDLLMRNIVVQFLNELREKQCGAIVFSPNPKEVFELCDRVYILRNGKLHYE